MKTSLLTVTLSFVFCFVTRAELKWEQTTVELNPALGDKQAIAHFKYQNIGTTPVHFKYVKASCGCTAAQSQKDQVNPGEKGEVTATFNIGDRTGLQVKNVTVQTDDPDPAHATTVLTLKTNITAALEARPPFLFWQGGEDPKPKKISVKAASGFPAKNVTAKSNNPFFSSKIEKGSGPGEWTVEVQPKDTSRMMGAALVLQADYPPQAPKSILVNLQVYPTQPTKLPPPAPAASPAAGGVQH
jgi:hypothetical protein